MTDTPQGTARQLHEADRIATRRGRTQYRLREDGAMVLFVLGDDNGDSGTSTIVLDREGRVQSCIDRPSLVTVVP